MRFDYSKLKGRIVEKDKKITDIADLLGISRQAIYNRLSGNTPFKDYEIIKIVDFLDIDMVDVESYFFKANIQ